MINRLKKMIRWARVTLAGSDDKQFPTQQVEYLEKPGDCFMVFPYGMHGNATPDSLVMMFSVYGDAAQRAGIPTTPQERPQMAAGEFCLYHPKTQSIIHFRSESGDIDIDVVKNKAGNININTTKANVTASDSVNVTAPNTNITGDVNITGDTVMTGNATVTGSTTLSSTVTSNGKDIGDGHSHSGSPTAPTGPVSNTGTPI